MARAEISDPFTNPAAVGAFTVWGGCTPAPCPLNYHSRQFPDSSRRIFSELPRRSFCSLLFHCFVVASSRFPHGFQSVPAAPICHGSVTACAVRLQRAGSAAAALFMAPIFTNYSPSKLLGDPLLKNPPYI